MFIIVHRTGTDLPDASAEFTCRVLAKVTNRELLSLPNGLVLKVPEREGDSGLIRKFFLNTFLTILGCLTRSRQRNIFRTNSEEFQRLDIGS